MKQGGGDDAIENAIAEKFQALVVGRAKTTMRQRRSEKLLIRKIVPQHFGDRERAHALLSSGRPSIIDQKADIQKEGNTFFIGKFDHNFAVFL
ncbi:MAG: hypothetical protein ACD_10C00493G0004 [uncultured bacterium]|nr:MAG: hypothetical protein ACD_10C00493G0004 [uncultured bacterium]